MQIDRLSDIGDIALPPDKSILQRAILLGAIAKGTTKIFNARLCGDAKSTLACAMRLGAKAQIFEDSVFVSGTSHPKKAVLDAENSATCARMLCGLLAGRTSVTILGDSSLCKRPMQQVILPLQLMGAKIASHDNYLPISLKKSKLSGITYPLPVASAQLKSALLFAGLSAKGTTVLQGKLHSRTHSEILLQEMGADIIANEQEIRISRSNLHAIDVVVPCDISSAAFFMVLCAILRKKHTFKNIGLNPYRTGILQVFERAGINVSIESDHALEPCGNITISCDKILPFDISEEQAPSLVDEVPILAVLACFATGTSNFYGLGQLKIKESDRLEKTALLLNCMGAKAYADEDSLTIEGNGSLRGGVCFDADGDHRMAMAAAIAGACAKYGVELESHECVNISFPDFFKVLCGLQ